MISLANTTPRATAYVEVRSQHACGSWPAQGPDTYVAVQIVPAGQTRLTVLNSRHASSRGIEIRYFGEGYRGRCATTRSMLGRALANAQEFAERFNAESLG